MKYAQHFNTRETPQSQKIPGSDQVPNSAGGYSFEVSNWDRLERFLILGAEEGSYYASEKKLVIQNSETVLKCIKENGLRTVQVIVDVSTRGRAPKNDPALFALAMCAGLGDAVTKKEALRVLPQVARIGTHLFQFVEAVEKFRGWGRGLKTGVGSWYLDKAPASLAYQLVKYQQREGWSHRDVLRLAKPVPQGEGHQALFKWATRGELAEDLPEDLKIVRGFEMAKGAKTVKEVLPLIEAYGLTREMIPTQFLKEGKVWEALLPGMPMTAMIRNLGNMSKSGILGQLSVAEKVIVERLGDRDFIRKARIHPLGVLVAMNTYKTGHGIRGSGTWDVNRNVVDALDEAFYLAFENVQPSGKRMLLALDVSGSMGGPEISGMPGISPRIGSAAMAMVTLKTEKNVATMAFSSQFVELDISRRKRLDDVVKAVSGIPFGGTDCSLPMIWALQRKIPVDAFVVYTDSETWSGLTHPVQALRKYRDAMGIPTKLIVVGMTSNGFTIADPKDSGMLDVVGFDTAAPAVMADFIRGGAALNADG
ncbi:MAG: TROVE domain-containing protein [Dehalococcoidia bacterium]|nr:TROVE domain-containing protein [Dehalococcoidia bacterium]